MWFRKNTKSIDHKFFKTMSTVAISFMLLLFFSTSLFVYQRFLNLESQDSLSRLDYISQQLNYYMISADNYSRTIIVNPDVQELTSKYNQSPEHFNALDHMNIKLQMNRTIQSTPFIHSVSLYSASGALITTTATYAWTDPMTGSDLQEDIQWKCRQQYSFTNKNEIVDVLTQSRPYYHTGSGKLLGYIQITIPEDNISGIYRSNSTADTRILMTDSEGIIRSTDGSYQLNTSYRNFNAAEHQGTFPFLVQNNKIIFSHYFPELDWYLFSETNLNAFLSPLFSLLSVTLLSTVICVLICIFVAHRTSKSITSPIRHLISHTRKIREGSWTPVQGEWDITEIGTLYEAFNEMIEAQDHLKDDLVESEKLKRRISLELLQQQVNPHFLYNTLDNIFSLAELDEKQVLLSTVMNLSTFYRLGLSSGRFHISIREELEITRAYLDIMQVRYFNKFDFAIHCPPHLYSANCLKLLLQPIVENSIYHGLKELSRPGYLEIFVKETEQGILFIVQDNGVGIPENEFLQIWSEDHQHFGIRNIHQRIEAYYGIPYGLTMANRESGGLIVTLMIKKQEDMSHA